MWKTKEGILAMAMVLLSLGILIAKEGEYFFGAVFVGLGILLLFVRGYFKLELNQKKK